MPPTGVNTNSTGLDTTTATQFLNDLLTAASSLWLEQFARWSDTFQKLRAGTYTSKQLQMDVARLWDPWLGLATFPVQWWTQFSRTLPTMLFLVDPVAGTAGPLDAPVTVSLPAGLTPQVDDLNPITSISVQTTGDTASTPKLEKTHIKVELLDEGNRVSVSLVDLGSDPATRQANNITPGFYVGPVYVKEVSTATLRPLALLYVLIT